jgi:Ca-activated chloride channel homolog
MGASSLVVAGRLVLVMLVLGQVLGKPAAADGIIIPEPPFEPLSIGYHRVQVEINGQVARTAVDQTFRNRQERDVEGTYLFPLPAAATVSDFAMHVDGEKLQAELLDADEARRIYEEIVRRRIDPALLEYVGRGAYRARIFPVPAQGERRIELAYEQVLGRDGGLVRYSYPLNTEKFSPEALDDVSVQVTIGTDGPIGAVYSPSHPVEIERLEDGRVRVVYADEGVIPQHDFVLYYAVADDEVGMELLSYFDEEGQGYYLLLAAPAVETVDDEAIPKRVVFAFDRSGSMRDGKIEQARQALRFAIENLGTQDEFNIVDYGTTVSSFAAGAVVADADNRRQALAYIDGIEAIGGTHIHAALLRALEAFNADGYAESLVFLTDGQPTIGKTDTDEILAAVAQARAAGVRLFVFGVGHEINTLLLDRLAADNGGTAAYVEPGEDIATRVSAFFAKVSRPVLTDLELSFTGTRVDDFYPQVLPDLFAGGQVAQLGRIDPAANVGVELRGQVQGQSRVLARDFNLPGGGPESLPRLWATRKVGFLLAQIRLNGGDQELVDEVVALARRYGIITPYTSFLIVEDEVPEPLIRFEEGGLGAVSGADAVATSEKLRSYAEASTPAASSEQMRYVGAKVFYQREGYWRDSRFSTEQETVEYVFGSQAYFEILGHHPDWGRFMALGRQVEFSHATGQVRVVESGTAVREENLGVVPAGPQLETVYPNPFNGSTVLRFSMAGGELELAVYDALGQKLKVLASGQRPAGRYSVVWDGRDRQGRRVGSGRYLVRLEAGGQSLSRTVSLVK